MCGFFADVSSCVPASPGRSFLGNVFLSSPSSPALVSYALDFHITSVEGGTAVASFQTTEAPSAAPHALLPSILALLPGLALLHNR